MLIGCRGSITGTSHFCLYLAVFNQLLRWVMASAEYFIHLFYPAQQSSFMDFLLNVDMYIFDQSSLVILSLIQISVLSFGW